MRPLILLIASMFMGGCVVNGIPNLNTNWVVSDVTNSVHKEYIGVPPFFSEDGSSVRLNDKWILSAKHISHILDSEYEIIHYHPSCDAALIYNEGVSKTKLGMDYEGDTVVHIVYPLSLPMAANKGEVFVDFYEDCWYSTSTASIIGGMSGGGVFNEENHLVGINIGVANMEYQGESYEKITMFLSILSIRDWIQEITNEELVFENANIKEISTVN